MEKRKAGFTLIELLVVIAVLGIVLGIGVSILTATFRSTNKTKVFNQVKQNGDFALETMTRSVRSAIDVCTTAGTDLVTYSATVNCASPSPSVEVTRFHCTLGGTGSDGEVDRLDNRGASIPLVSSVKISSCAFAITSSIPKRVTIDFTFQQSTSLGTSTDVIISIPFHTEVTVRNF
jgi:prepilin-type N-terminal cleavage/methylation domain-containing protein